jgi:hypothetical protein
MTGGAGQVEQDMQNKTVRTGQSELDSRMGQAEQEHAEQD